MAYRVVEELANLSTGGVWSEAVQHTLPPLAMLALALSCWRLVPPLPLRAHPGSAGLGLAVAVGMLLGTAAALCNLLTMLAASPRGPGWSGVASVDAGAAALVLHVAILAPVAEEVTFRGLIYRVFRRRLAPWAAILVSALIFGLMHVQPAKGLWAFLLGGVAAAAYEQTRSLWTPVLIHALFNAVPIGVAVLRAKPDDTGPVWLVLAVVAVIFALSARSARRTAEA